VTTELRRRVKKDESLDGTHQSSKQQTPASHSGTSAFLRFDHDGSFYDAIDEQLSWHLRQHSTHLSMLPTCSQLSAQALQISAHARQYKAWLSLLRLMKSTQAAHAAMQSSISFTWVCSTCEPPSFRQWRVSMSAQVV
jgi:hypothetical protein